MEKPTSRLTLDLPSDMHRRLKILAATRGQSMKHLIMEWVRLGLDAEEAASGPREAK